MTAKGKITAANAVPGTIVRIALESDFVADLYERKPEWTAARIKRDSKLAEVLENVALGGGKRMLVTKFGNVTVVGHQTFILAKDGEKAEEPEPETTPETVEEPQPVSAEEILRNGTIENVSEPGSGKNVVPAATFALSEEEIAENAAAKLADTIRRDEEMRNEKIREDEAIFPEPLYRMSVVDPISEESTQRNALKGIESGEAFLAASDRFGTAERERLSARFATARLHFDREEYVDALSIAEDAQKEAAHILRLREEYARTSEWRKERIQAALMRYGTVPYPEGTPEYAEYSEKVTAALDEWKKRENPEPVIERTARVIEAPEPEKKQEPAAYLLIEFERIGRNYNVRPLRVRSDETSEELEVKIGQYARKFLSSKEFDVTVLLRRDPMEVLIDGGRFGKGTIRTE